MTGLILGSMGGREEREADPEPMVLWQHRRRLGEKRVVFQPDAKEPRTTNRHFTSTTRDTRTAGRMCFWFLVRSEFLGADNDRRVGSHPPTEFYTFPCVSI